MRVHRFDNAPRPLAWLPKREGFKFIAVFKDGTEVETHIEQRAGTYFIADVRTPDVLKGWKPLPIDRGVRA